jgi:hypothetical protein
MGPPLGGSFRQLEELTGVTAAGYNEPSDDGGNNVVPHREAERVPDLSE